ncbi:MAG: hypothetical protein K0S39_3755 [Paenibacillus sp.]|jgi:hypothetical protein|nr:hypothetical protein [Paenibacillus sp.]
MYEQLFSLAGFAMPFWLLLFLLPAWRVTQFLANKAVFPIYLALLYSAGIIITITERGLGFMSRFSTSEGVITLLADPGFALLVWLHLLCFDQAVGHYVYMDNMKHRYVPLPVQSVLLFLILMLGPLGFLCYVALKMVTKRVRAGSGTI